MSDVLAAIQCGWDWWMQLVYTDAGGNPVAVTSPKMEIRAGRDKTSDLLFSSLVAPNAITFTQPQSNIVKASILGSATKGVFHPQAFWDCFATDPSGAVVMLGSGPATITPNVSAI